LIVGGTAGLIHDGWDSTVITVAAAVWLALAVIGLTQLAVAVRRQLT
jgi:hypothetical protein